jgi:hypothetical protein
MAKQKPIFESGLVFTRKASLMRMSRWMDKEGMDMEISPMLERGGVYTYKIFKKRR